MVEMIGQDSRNFIRVKINNLSDINNLTIIFINCRTVMYAINWVANNFNSAKPTVIK